MKKMLLASIALSALVLWAISCGGSAGSGGGTPTAPSNPAPQTSTTVNIIGLAGSSAFAPNPV